MNLKIRRILNRQSRFATITIGVLWVIGLTGGCLAIGATGRWVRSAIDGPAYGVISGRVVGDGGQPLIDATISARRVDARGAAFRNATTDDNGNFKIPDLSLGVYTVTVSAPGYVDPQRVDPSNPRYVRVGETLSLTLIKGGAITGKITDANNQPAIGVQVRANLIKDLDGRTNQMTFGQARSTDDRGIYRLYGLGPGVYVVSTTTSQIFARPTPYDNDVPTYYPSETRDTATEVTVHAGGEAAGIDIRLRGEAGHIISGTIAGGSDAGQFFGISVILARAGSSLTEMQTSVNDRLANSFSLRGIADGDYDLVARQLSTATNIGASGTQRVKVRGKDVTGLRLTMVATGGISGRLAISPTAPQPADAAPCLKPQEFVFEDAVVMLHRIQMYKSEVDNGLLASLSTSVPGSKGEFEAKSLDPARYQLDLNLGNKNFYVRSIGSSSSAVKADGAAAPAAANSSPFEPLREPIDVRPGQRGSSLTMTLAQGAGELQGKVDHAVKGTGLPAHLVVDLVPTDSDEAWRFRETVVDTDGTFKFINVAPGKYAVMARISPLDTDLKPVNSIVWISADRTSLAKRVESTKAVVEVKPCQQITGVAVSYAAPGQVQKKTPTARP